MPEVLLVLRADVLDQIGVGVGGELKIHSPRFGVGFRVVDGDLKIDVAEVAAVESFCEVQGLRPGVAAVGG